MKMRLLLWLSLWAFLPAFVFAQTPAVEEPLPKAAEPAPPAAAAPPAAVVPAKEVSKSGPVFVVPLRGTVSDPQFYFVRRALKEAKRAQASAVILEIDTYGGNGDPAMKQMDAILTSDVPTYAFVNPNAISAGSMVSLATKRIYMSPTAVIGASAVVSASGQDLEKTMGEKMTSIMVAKARGAASANGHPEDVAEAFVRESSEVWRGWTKINGKETLLTLNAQQAITEYNGKPLLAAGLVNSVEEVAKAEGLTGPLQRFEPTGFETIASWLTAIAPLLLAGGLLGAYLEFKTPGFGLPGICSLICFSLFFASSFLAGLAGMEAVVIFLIGLVLVILEFFVFPGLIIPGLIGALMIVGSLVWAMVDHWPTEDGGWKMPTGSELERPILNLVIAVAGTAVAMGLLAKYLPKTALYRHLVLENAVPTGAGVSSPVVNIGVPIGAAGKALTTLRPAGKAEIDGQTHDVVTGGEYIEAGTLVRVVSADGMRVVVEAV